MKKLQIISFVMILFILCVSPVYGHTLPCSQQKIVVSLVGDKVVNEPVLHKELNYFNVEGLMLYEGIASEEVVMLHRFLVQKGYEGLGEGYYFNSTTSKAVKDYQAKSGLEADGYVGKKTYTAINEDIKKNDILIKKVIITFNKEVPIKDWLLINKTNNTLYHLEGTTLKGKYHVATGKQPSYTPEGKFTIVTKYVNPYWGGANGKYKPVKGGAPNNPLGKRWMGLNIGGGGQYGIHGNAAKSSIGTYASLGCIRMYNEEVEALFDIIPNGTEVWIGNTDKLKDYGIEFN